MSEVMERKDLTMDEVPEVSTAVSAEQTDQRAGLTHKWKGMPRKKRRKIIRWIVIVLILALLGFGVYKLFGGKGGKGEEQVITDTVQYGSITSKVEGSGMTRAKENAAITITTPGTMTEVLVTEGQQVTAGDPLFVVDSPEAVKAVEKARQDVEGIQKQISALQKNMAGLHLAPSYPGKLMNVKTLNPGDVISAGTPLADLNDDTRLRLEQYYSYAYEGDLYAGQEVQVSIPSMMSALTGKVEKVNMVSRITPEGSKLFSVTILVNNEGALTAGMTASATVTVNGETVYPYEPGQLEYYRTGQLVALVGGTVISSKLVNYLHVEPGQVLVNIDGEDSEAEMYGLQERLEAAQQELDKAQKNLNNCRATAPISGTVIGLTTTAGSEIDTQAPICTISDTSTVLINADVDERNVSLVKAGNAVDLNQWDHTASGVVESVSLSSTVNNGVARYPIVISADNPDGTLQVNSYISYSLIASENDNCLVLPLQCVRTVSLEDGTPASVVYVKGEKPANALEGIMADEQIPEGFWPVQVEIGIQDTFNVEIKSGVEEGMEVFTQIQTTEVWG